MSQFQVIAFLGTIAIHTGEENLARSKALHLYCPLHRVEARWGAPPMGIALPAQSRSGAIDGVLDTTCIDGHDKALAAATQRCTLDQRRLLHRSGINRDLVGGGVEQVTHILKRPRPGYHGQWHEDLLGGAGDDVEDDLT